MVQLEILRRLRDFRMTVVSIRPLPDTSVTTMDKPDFSIHFLEGIDHFNSRRFWEAHEAWETLWLVAESDLEQYLQGLIQIAAAYHHIQRRTYRGAPRLFAAGLQRLEAFPLIHCGLDRTAVDAAARRHREWLETSAVAPSQPLPEDQYPKLEVMNRAATAPSSLQW
jgi:predicted metal-dependent hydrolase